MTQLTGLDRPLPSLPLMGVRSMPSLQLHEAPGRAESSRPRPGVCAELALPATICAKQASFPLVPRVMCLELLSLTEMRRFDSSATRVGLRRSSSDQALKMCCGSRESEKNDGRSSRRIAGAPSSSMVTRWTLPQHPPSSSPARSRKVPLPGNRRPSIACRRWLCLVDRANE